MARRLFVLLVLIPAATVLASGCGSGPETATVSGGVSVDGKPLENGVIAFTGPDGKTATAKVANGKYDLRTTLGNNQVQISAPVVTGKRKESSAPDAPLVEITAESLPDRYNAKSGLAFEVKSGANTKDWEVESIKRK